jgi:hypothetical protein
MQADWNGSKKDIPIGFCGIPIGQERKKERRSVRFWAVKREDVFAAARS